MSQWREISIGWFTLEVGLVSVVLIYTHKKGYLVTVQGFFHSVQYNKYIQDLEESKRVGIRLLKDELDKLQAVATSLVH